MNKYRTHNCSELSEKEINKTVHISGWLHRKRDHGNLLFVDLRAVSYTHLTLPTKA